jgi:hypothetical protein
MRSGEKTVLSMQNNYTGPAEDFALVVPVPEVLQEANVKTLAEELFAKIDRLSAPRLVEYWQEDPCNVMFDEAMRASAGGAPEDYAADADVTVEAEFQVGEYQIVILSTTEATALQTWLETNEYNIPSGASDYFDPYVRSGMYFFVAKVDTDLVTVTEDGLAVLSPLRFDYDSTEFKLPVRLGLINSKGEQDLIVYTLAPGQRYEVASRPNVTIPTNILVDNAVRDNFGDFYRLLYAETLARNPGAVVTEYSWAANTCDPCPGPTLDGSDLETLGNDVLEEDRWDWVLTRLHLRYGPGEAADDLVFTTAPAISGGRGSPNDDGTLGQEVSTDDVYANQFQGRYAIVHPWDGDVDCGETYVQWGASSGAGSALSPNTTRTSTSAATSGDQTLVDYIAEDVPGLGLIARRAVQVVGAKDGCACNSAGASGLLLLLGWFAARRRTRA